MKKLTTLASAAVLAVAASQASAAMYEISGSFGVMAVGFNIPFTVNSGMYDDATDTGYWNVTSDLSVFAAGSISFDQTFTLDSITGAGLFNAPTNCVGQAGACLGLGANFQGPAQATSALPIGEGLQSWTVTTGMGPIVFAPMLTAETAPEVPVPAAAWLMGSALLSLAGIGRRRKAAQA